MIPTRARNRLFGPQEYEPEFDNALDFVDDIMAALNLPTSFGDVFVQDGSQAWVWSTTLAAYVERVGQAGMDPDLWAYVAGTIHGFRHMIRKHAARNMPEYRHDCWLLVNDHYNMARKFYNVVVNWEKFGKNLQSDDHLVLGMGTRARAA